MTPELEAVRILAAEIERLRAQVAESRTELTWWQEWSNSLTNLIPDGDESVYANPEGAQEAIISDCFTAYMDERDRLRAHIDTVRDRVQALAKAEQEVLDTGQQASRVERACRKAARDAYVLVLEIIADEVDAMRCAGSTNYVDGRGAAVAAKMNGDLQ